MQAVPTKFTQYAIGPVRPLSWGLRISFDKTFNPDTTFFTLDVSKLDGVDILAPSEDNPLLAWYQYAYADFSSRVLSLEVTREETEPYSITQAYADVVLNNYDSYFTPKSGSPIDEFILPRRPFRIAMGFGATVLQQIVGLSDDMPRLDKDSRTASFHVIDFMSYLMGKDIGNTIMLENVKTHQILDYLLQYLGLSSDQYVLDGSVNTVKFFYVESGTTFGTVLTKLMEAEIGIFYMDESGIIRFKNRYNYSLDPVYTFDKSNTLDYKISDQSRIINSVKVTGSIREVQGLKSIGTGQSTEIAPGAMVEVFVNFNDPVTSADDPVYSETPLADSYFTSVLSSDSVTPYSNINLNSMDVFSKSAKLTFENVGVSQANIKTINIFGTPAEVVQTLNVTDIDQDSIDKFEEQDYPIDNEYIQDTNSAQTRARMLIRDYKDYASEVDLEVKGNPALQTGDAVRLDLDGFQGVHLIKKITNITSDSKFTQRLRALKKQEVSFFTLDTSLLDGESVLSP